MRLEKFCFLFDIYRKCNRRTDCRMLKSMLFCFIESFVLVNLLSAATINDANNCTEYPCVIFEENFDTLDHKTWTHWITAAATGNKEFQYYANNRSNSFVKEGRLNLRATLTNNTFDDEFLTGGTLDLWPGNRCTSNRRNKGCYYQGNKDVIVKPIQSAAISTEGVFSFKYGELEVSAKITPWTRNTFKTVT